MKLIFFILFLAQILSVEAPSEKCTGIGADYRGVNNHTYSRKKCLNWSDFFVRTYSSTGLGSHNFCRNPTLLSSGPYCITKYGYSFPDTIESCGVYCNPGFAISKFHYSCAEVAETLSSPSFKECSEACLKRPGCKSFAISLSCYVCKKGDKGAYKMDHFLYAYSEFPFLHRCSLSEKDQSNKNLNVTKCASKLKVSDSLCKVTCAKNYVGSVTVTCNETSVFNVEHSCQKGCYIVEEEIENTYELGGCKSSVRNLLPSKDCSVSCKHEKKAKPIKVKCHEAGQKFELVGDCPELTCRVNDRTKKKLQRVNLKNCKSKTDLTVENCKPKCLRGFVGNVDVQCKPDGFFEFTPKCTRKLKL